MLFKPNNFGYWMPLGVRGKKITSPQPNTLDKSRKLDFTIAFAHGLPETDEQLSAIIDTMSPKFHLPFVRSQLTIARNAMSQSSAPYPLSFRDLEMWAAASDAAYANHAYNQKATDKNAGRLGQHRPKLMQVPRIRDELLLHKSSKKSHQTPSFLSGRSGI